MSADERRNSTGFLSGGTDAQVSINDSNCIHKFKGKRSHSIQIKEKTSIHIPECTPTSYVVIIARCLAESATSLSLTMKATIIPKNTSRPSIQRELACLWPTRRKRLLSLITHRMVLD